MIILASQSPRRRELMERMGLSFAVVTADIDETMDPDVPVREELSRLSRRKAEAVVSRVTPGDLIVAADTIVCVDDRRLGKPKTEEEACAMLRLLSGRSHTVITGICVLQGGRVQTRTVETTIHFRPLSEAEIRAYVATGEPMDKAGAYGIQGKAAIFVDRLNGDYYNVMGLPVCELTGMLRSFGVAVLDCVSSDEDTSA